MVALMVVLMVMRMVMRICMGMLMVVVLMLVLMVLCFLAVRRQRPATHDQRAASRGESHSALLLYHVCSVRRVNRAPPFVHPPFAKSYDPPPLTLGGS